jgi:arginine decarboxylase
MRVHVASGVGRGPTDTAAYDAALAAAGVHNYNLVPVSSVLPADAEVVEVDAVPPLGPAGNRLTVVQSRATATSGRLAAGLGWATGPGPGILYEATGTDAGAVRSAVERGLDAGCELRDWTFDDRTVRVRTAAADRPATIELDGGEPPRDAGDDPRHTCVVYLAAYGESEPIG